MTKERVDEFLDAYRSNQARCAYLQEQVIILEESLRKNEMSAIGDQVSMSQAITGMPHGTTVGDPVGNLALDIAMGNVSVFVKQIQEELASVRAELNQKSRIVAYVGSWLNGLNERERFVVEAKVIDHLAWAEVVKDYNARFNGSYSKHTIQRLHDKAMDKIYEIAA